MSDTFSRPARRVTLALAVLLAAASFVTGLVLGPGVLEVWWPRTGDAFAATATTQHAVTVTDSPDDPCDLIVGPVKEHCQRVHTTPPPSSPGDGLTRTSVLLLIPAALGVAVLLRQPRRHP
ncbi:hypothetical protein ACFQ7F_34670 [Streptomyces sp. NPDC056486]|uniref:hypothetical protein n=1 Tax=Streptomyces sp. NPDC056486 TaxID=3345835 RepID=UPI0036AEE2DE